ncbi:hypothetical protein BC828DRAFT_416740, partial [Blastocladiella britannica]
MTQRKPLPPAWLQDLTAAETATADMLSAMADALDLLATAPRITSTLPTADEVGALEEHAVKLRDTTDAYFDSLYTVQRNMRSTFRLLSALGINTVTDSGTPVGLPGLHAATDDHERALAISTGALHIAAAHVDAMRKQPPHFAVDAQSMADPKSKSKKKKNEK